jgi:hypothetical protein
MKGALLQRWSTTRVRSHGNSPLHACTPARCVLGSAPAGRLPNTLFCNASLGSLRNTLNASSLVSSLIVEGKSGILAPGSQIVDLTSPNAKRQTIRPELSLVAPIHNQNESLPSTKLSNECSQPAPQAASRPIHENAPCENGLIDCMGSLAKLQKRLLVALKGIPCSLSPLHCPTIHNFWLCIALQESGLAAPFQQTRPVRKPNQTNSKQTLRPHKSCHNTAMLMGLPVSMSLATVLAVKLRKWPRRPRQ